MTPYNIAIRQQATFFARSERELPDQAGMLAG